MKLIPCCEPFGTLIANSGEKGIAVVPRIRDGIRGFFLQARPFEPNVASMLLERDPATGENKWPLAKRDLGYEVPLVTVLALPLRFCPACGQNLHLVIDSNTAAFDADARSAEHLWRE